MLPCGFSFCFDTFYTLIHPIHTHTSFSWRAFTYKQVFPLSLIVSILFIHIPVHTTHTHTSFSRRTFIYNQVLPQSFFVSILFTPILVHPIQTHTYCLYLFWYILQGPTLTFEGNCPFGQSDPKFCLPEKKSTCPKEKCYFALFYHLHSDILVWNDNLKMTAEILVLVLLLNKKQ